MSRLQILRFIASRLKRRQANKERERCEDFLKALYHYGLTCPSEERIEYIRQQARIPLSALPTIIGQLVLQGYITTNPLCLSERGRQRALRLVRAHRIYEKYLAEHSGYSPEEWHSKAEEMEHKLSNEEQERIARLLRNPLWDPHGDPIPTAQHLLPQSPTQAEEAKEGAWYRVQHVEDDDKECFRLIHRLGITQGCILEIRKRVGDSLELMFEGEEVLLPLKALRSLTLVSLESDDKAVRLAQSVVRLTQLQLGDIATIACLSPACVGAMRRRLMDLGFVRGSEISIDMHSPLGNPTAYVIRHTAIALREDQARYILIIRKNATTESANSPYPPA